MPPARCCVVGQGAEAWYVPCTGKVLVAGEAEAVVNVMLNTVWRMKPKRWSTQLCSTAWACVAAGGACVAAEWVCGSWSRGGAERKGRVWQVVPRQW